MNFFQIILFFCLVIFLSGCKGEVHHRHYLMVQKNYPTPSDFEMQKSHDSITHQENPLSETF